MTAQVLRSEDPRDMLEKATRDELVTFAHAMGQADIVETMPATRIRDILRERNLRDIRIADRPLGTFISKESYGLVGSPIPQTIKPETETEPPVDIDSMTMGQLRVACKARGIKMARTDNMETLRSKLRG